MPDAATPLADPDGQALMNVLSDLGAPPLDAYNATEGVRNMAGRNVTVRLEAKIETLSAEIGGLGGKVDILEGKIGGPAPASQMDALTSQVRSLTAPVESPGFQLQSLTSQVESQGVQLRSLTSQVESHGIQLQTLTSTVQDLSIQMQSLVAQAEPLVVPTGDLATQVAALTAHVQGQAAQAQVANWMLTLLTTILVTIGCVGLFKWFREWSRAQWADAAGGSSDQSES